MKTLKSRTDVDSLMAGVEAASTTIAARAAQKIAPRFARLAREAFDAQESVYGDPYPIGANGPLDLVASGKMKAEALKYEAIGSKVRCSVGGVRHAKFYIRFGILPRNGSLPAAWQDVVREECKDAIRTELGQ